MIVESNKCAEEAATAHRRRARRGHLNQDDKRAARAFNLVQMGELSAGRQGLEGSRAILAQGFKVALLPRVHLFVVFLSFASTSDAHGTQRMEIFRCTNWIGHSWSPSTIRAMAPSWAAVKARATAASCQSPHSAVKASTEACVEDVRVAAVHGSSHEGFRGEAHQ